eukprot:m.1279398 g.1279398  ORF g.1279398 m.1279398 type:complete len:56 (+) comp24767_c0_seq27:1469-1636(+)
MCMLGRWHLQIANLGTHNGERDHSLLQPTCRLGETQWHGFNYVFDTWCRTDGIGR